MRKEISVAFLVLATVAILLMSAWSTQEGTTEFTPSVPSIHNTQHDTIRKEKYQYTQHESTTTEIEKNEEKSEKETTEEWIVNLTQEELEDFYKIVYAEDGIEDEDTQVAVAATILNRMLSENFMHDFYAVIYQENAFSSVHDQKIYIMTEEPYEVTLDMVPESTKNAVNRALLGEDPTEEALREEARRLGLDEDKYAAGGALYFYYPGACGPEELARRQDISVQVNIGYQYYYKVWD